MKAHNNQRNHGSTISSNFLKRIKQIFITVNLLYSIRVGICGIHWIRFSENFLFDVDSDGWDSEWKK